jgi:hypothetical protein
MTHGIVLIVCLGLASVGLSMFSPHFSLLDAFPPAYLLQRQRPRTTRKYASGNALTSPLGQGVQPGDLRAVSV